MSIYLFSQILKFKKYSIKLIEKLSRRHLINSSDVFVIKGFTVSNNLTNYGRRHSNIFTLCIKLYYDDGNQKLKVVKNCLIKIKIT